jgi:hypothetical protein
MEFRLLAVLMGHINHRNGLEIKPDLFGLRELKLDKRQDFYAYNEPL